MGDDELRIDYVSPLPPVRSGISDYSADLLPHLAKSCDLRLIRLPEQPVEESICERYSVVDAQLLGEAARLPLYQMGNNRYHRAVWDLAMARPGVLTLHDLILHHFLIERSLKYEDFETYRAGLAADHGWIGEAVAEPTRWPGASSTAAQFSLPAHRTLLARQHGVLVHSAWAQEQLSDAIDGLRVRHMSMGVPLPKAADEQLGRAFRQRHGIPVDSPVVGSFGFQTPMKRTATVMEVLTSEALGDVHLMVAGEVAPILELERRAAEAGMAERVHVLGFLPFDEFEAAIAAADLCLNLRYPTAGETSASLLRILAVGRPAVVSDHAQNADLPDDVVVKIPVGEGEGEELHRRLCEWVKRPEDLERMGRAARQHIARTHRLEDAAAAVIEACREWRRPAPQPAMTFDIPTTMAWDQLEGDVIVKGAESPWPAGQRRVLEVHLRNRSVARWLAGERLTGGVALEVQLWVGETNLYAEQGWIGLPLDLEPGETHVFTVTIRRPLKPQVRLCLIPHVLSHTSLADLGGPQWQAEL